MQPVLIWQLTFTIWGDTMKTTYTWLDSILWVLWVNINVRFQLYCTWMNWGADGRQVGSEFYSLFICFYFNESEENTHKHTHVYYHCLMLWDPPMPPLCQFLDMIPHYMTYSHDNVEWNTSQNTFWFCSVIHYIRVTNNSQFVSCDALHFPIFLI